MEEEKTNKQKNKVKLWLTIWLRDKRLNIMKQVYIFLLSDTKKPFISNKCAVKETVFHTEQQNSGKVIVFDIFDKYNAQTTGRWNRPINFFLKGHDLML